ncbi:MAG: ChbG/HpnK family deacetylase [Bryobacteraceae bacterium]|nr:ChbG/HpnK family deacetylase [Bryobacteraceae bacterium]
MGAARILTVNADDFGFTRGVNRGIVDCHLRGILTSTTLMANGEAFEDAVRLAREHPTLDVGAHFALVQGRSLVTGEPLPATVAELVCALALRRLDPYQELKAQLEKILAAGVRVTHFDTHKHTHLLPPVLEAVLRLAQETGVRWVRRPFDLPLPASRRGTPPAVRVARRAMALAERRFEQRICRAGCRTTDHFAGFQWTGRFDSSDVASLLRALPEGVTEFMTHPGYCDEELRKARTRLKESREAELRALTDPRVREALREAQVRLASYAQLEELAGEAQRPK